MLTSRVSVNEGETVDLQARRGTRFDLPITYGTDDLSTGFTARFVVRKYATDEGDPLIEWLSGIDIELGEDGLIHVAPDSELDLDPGPYEYSLTIQPAGQQKDPITSGLFIVMPLAGAE